MIIFDLFIIVNDVAIIHRGADKSLVRPTSFFCRNKQSEYLGTLWADVRAVSRGEVPSSEEISVVDSINCGLMYGSS